MKATDELPGLLVIGTDTGVGKTRVACWIAQSIQSAGRRVGVCKPAVSGAEGPAESPNWLDVDALMAVTNNRFPDSRVAPYRWWSPLAPPAAFARDGRTWTAAGPIGRLPTLGEFSSSLDPWANEAEVVVVEGCGGLLCPLTETETLADLVLEMGRPAVLVARLGLGAINHVLMTLEIATARDITVAGVILNRPTDDPDGLAERTNPAEIRKRTRVPVWGPLPHQALSDPIPDPILAIDWCALARPRGGRL